MVFPKRLKDEWDHRLLSSLVNPRAITERFEVTMRSQGSDHD